MRFGSGEIITIPSPIDVHTHLREPGGEQKETIESGTRAALYGGYQAVFDMPNNPGGNETWTVQRLKQKYELADSSAQTNIGFYAGVDLANPEVDEMESMIPWAAGLKIYLGHTTGNTKEYVLDDARESIDQWIKGSRQLPNAGRSREGGMPPILLHAREGVGYEVAEYIARQEYPVHWCHLSTASEANMASRLRKLYPDYMNAGVTPHHLTMTEIDADYKYGWLGARMMPPLGGEADHDALIDFYNAGFINILETDHAPHTSAEKLTAETENPTGKTDTDCVTCFGVSSVEFVLPVMMGLVQRNKISMERLEDSLYQQPARMLGLKPTRRNRTTLKVEPHVIGEHDRIGKSANNPYVGWTGWAKVLGVEINGVDWLQYPKSWPEFKPMVLRTGAEV